MQNKSTGNGGKKPRRSVKKQQEPSIWDDIIKNLEDANRILDETNKGTPRKPNPTLDELIEEHRRLSEENLKRSKQLLKETQERSKQMEEALSQNTKIILMRRLRELTKDPAKNYGEINQVITELEKLHGIEPSPHPNHCKTCLFQKLCSKFTEDGINGLTCSFADYNNRIRDLIREGDFVAYDRRLIFWDDTQEQLDARFNLS